MKRLVSTIALLALASCESSSEPKVKILEGRVQTVTGSDQAIDAKAWIVYPPDSGVTVLDREEDARAYAQKHGWNCIGISTSASDAPTNLSLVYVTGSGFATEESELHVFATGEDAYALAREHGWRVAAFQVK